MIIERLSREHRNIEMLLAILERELEVVDRGGRPDYEVIRAIISYFEVYPEVYHHPQEDVVFAKLKPRGKSRSRTKWAYILSARMRWSARNSTMRHTQKTRSSQAG